MAAVSIYISISVFHHTKTYSKEWKKPLNLRVRDPSITDDRVEYKLLTHIPPPFSLSLSSSPVYSIHTPYTLHAHHTAAPPPKLDPLPVYFPGKQRLRWPLTRIAIPALASTFTVHFGGETACWMAGAVAADPKGVFACRVLQGDLCAHFTQSIWVIDASKQVL